MTQTLADTLEALAAGESYSPERVGFYVRNNLPTILAALELQERLDAPETVEVVARGICLERDSEDRSDIVTSEYDLDLAQAAIAAMKGASQ